MERENIKGLVMPSRKTLIGFKHVVSEFDKTGIPKPEQFMPVYKLEFNTVYVTNSFSYWMFVDNPGSERLAFSFSTWSDTVKNIFPKKLVLKERRVVVKNAQAFYVCGARKQQQKLILDKEIVSDDTLGDFIPANQTQYDDMIRNMKAAFSLFLDVQTSYKNKITEFQKQ